MSAINWLTLAGLLFLVGFVGLLIGLISERKLRQGVGLAAFLAAVGGLVLMAAGVAGP